MNDQPRRTLTNAAIAAVWLVTQACRSELPDDSGSRPIIGGDEHPYGDAPLGRGPKAPGAVAGAGTARVAGPDGSGISVGVTPGRLESTVAHLPSRPPTRGVPEGWRFFPIFGSEYGVWYPPTQQLLPAAIKWRDCVPPLAEVSSCREMDVTWATDDEEDAGARSVDAHVDDDGRVLLQLRRSYRDGEMSAAMGLLVEADGPVRHAFWEEYAPRGGARVFAVGPAGIAGEKSVWRALRLEGETFATLIMDGSVPRPRLAVPPSTAYGRVYPGQDHYAVIRGSGAVAVRRWSGEDLGELLPSIDSMTAITWASGAGYVGVTALTGDSQIVRWGETTGTRPFLGPSAGSFDTDERDMVWLEENSGADGDRTRAIMSAPFSPTGTVTSARRIARWVGLQHIAFAGTTVGCGHAAFAEAPTSDVSASNIVIVRLSDARTWRIRSPDGARARAWRGPVAVTCDEVFAAAGDNVRRFPLDALGVGSAAP